MNTKQIIIHTGFHKTASSSIQHTLGLNRQLLQDKGYHYPNLKVDGKQLFNQSIPLFGYYTEAPQNFKQYWYHNNVSHQRINGLIKQFLEHDISKYNKIIFSDEFISKLSIDALKLMKNDFESLGYQLRIISFIREPFSLAVSSIQQQAHSQGIEKIIKKQTNSTIVPNITNILSVFPDAEFFSFEHACNHKSGPVGFFLDLLNVHLDTNKMVRINESMSQQAARLSSHINTRAPLFLSGNKLNPIRTKDDIVGIYQIKGHKFALTNTEMKLVEPQCLKNRKDISNILGEDFLPEPAINAVDHIQWSDSQIEYLISIQSNLNLYVLLEIYNYFAINNLSHLTKLSTLNKIIRSRVDHEFISVKVNKINYKTIKLFLDRLSNKIQRLLFQL